MAKSPAKSVLSEEFVNVKTKLQLRRYNQTKQVYLLECMNSELGNQWGGQSCRTYPPSTRSSLLLCVSVSLTRI